MPRSIINVLWSKKGPKLDPLKTEPAIGNEKYKDDIIILAQKEAERKAVTDHNHTFKKLRLPALITDRIKSA